MAGLALLLSIALTATDITGDQTPMNQRRDSVSESLLPKVLTMQGFRDPIRLSIKTNAIPWAATVMNIAGEVAVADHVSISLPVWWCPWFISKAHALRVLALQPEGRWWFEETGSGHFVGPHFSLAWFNLRHNGIRYQDKGRPLLGAGVTYGYRLKLNRVLDLEFSVGAGFMSIRYDRFYNVTNGVLIDTRQTSYLGIDHAGVSLVYNFNL